MSRDDARCLSDLVRFSIVDALSALSLPARQQWGYVIWDFLVRVRTAHKNT